MHASSMVNMKKMLTEILTPDFIGTGCTVVDYGGRIIDQAESYKSLVSDVPNVTYKSLDITAGDGVDIVMANPYRVPLDDNSVDVVISGQVLEHCEFFWLTMQDMARIVRPGGYVLIIAPSDGGVHRHPVDCWRFLVDAYAALAKWSKLELLKAWREDVGPWHDQVGMFRKP